MDLGTVKVSLSIVRCTRQASHARIDCCCDLRAHHCFPLQKKIERNEYSSPKEFRHDVTLVWANCMTYNADGSPYYILAQNLAKLFDEKWTKTIRDEDESGDQHRPPTLVDKKMFAQNIYNLQPEDLGRVVQLLDQRCEAAIKKIDPEDLEIDVDAIDPPTFWLLDGFVKDALPGGKKHGAGRGKKGEPAAKKGRTG